VRSVIALSAAGITLIVAIIVGVVLFGTSSPSEGDLGEGVDVTPTSTVPDQSTTFSPSPSPSDSPTDDDDDDDNTVSPAPPVPPDDDDDDDDRGGDDDGDDDD